jgi:hypothetical protein
MDDYVQQHFPVKPGGKFKITPELFDQFREVGLDLNVWFSCRSLFALAGPVAEAMFTKTPIEDFLVGPECAQDIGDVRHAAKLIRQEFNIDTMDRMINVIIDCFKNPQIWKATLAIANCLQIGETPGQRIMKVFNSYITAASSDFCCSQFRRILRRSTTSMRRRLLSHINAAHVRPTCPRRPS